ncbi:MAG: rod shape-determining protein, partial [Flexilinea sp.]|nr:rod shape-determining protein [Flexilinea sp.]
MALFSRELGIDLGTLSLVIAEGKQLLLQEPTIAAIIVEEMKMVEWGQAAKDMVGRVPESIEVVRPLRNGVIAEYEITENLLRFAIQKVSGSMLV